MPPTIRAAIDEHLKTIMDMLTEMKADMKVGQDELKVMNTEIKVAQESTNSQIGKSVESTNTALAECRNAIARCEESTRVAIDSAIGKSEENITSEFNTNVAAVEKQVTAMEEIFTIVEKTISSLKEDMNSKVEQKISYKIEDIISNDIEERIAENIEDKISLKINEKFGDIVNLLKKFIDLEKRTRETKVSVISSPIFALIVPRLNIKPLILGRKSSWSVYIGRSLT